MCFFHILHYNIAQLFEQEVHDRTLTLKALKPYIEPEKIEESKAPVRAAYRYINNRPDQLDYAGSIAEKLPIGSGLIESGHKHLIQARLKIAGAAWHINSAQNIAQARTIRANKGGEQYWKNN